jgi:hypothetical protein
MVAGGGVPFPAGGSGRTPLPFDELGCLYDWLGGEDRGVLGVAKNAVVVLENPVIEVSVGDGERENQRRTQERADHPPTALFPHLDECYPTDANLGNPPVPRQSLHVS